MADDRHLSTATTLWGDSRLVGVPSARTSFNTESTAPFSPAPVSPGSNSVIMVDEPEDEDGQVMAWWNRSAHDAKQSAGLLENAHHQVSRYFNKPLLDRTGLCDTALTAAQRYPRNERNAIIAYAATRPLLLERFPDAVQSSEEAMSSLYTLVQADKQLRSGVSGPARVRALMDELLSGGDQELGMQAWRDIFEEELVVASASLASDEA